MQPISVVIPLYNKGQFISRAINSVMSQTVLPKEIIVVDDGSTDGGGETVEDMNNPLIRLIRQENQGVSVARNVGIALAKGELIAFLDADDEWKPRFLEIISDMRRLYPQAGAYATAFDTIGRKGHRYIKKFKGLLPPSDSPSQHQFIENIFSTEIDPVILWTSALVVPRSVFKETGFFKEGERRAQDIDMWVRIGIYYPVVFNSGILATYRQDAQNRISKIEKYNCEPAFSKTISEAINSKKVPLEKMQGLKEFGAYWRYLVIPHLIANKQKELAIKMINETKDTQKFWRQGWLLLIYAYLPSYFMKFTLKMYRYLFVDNPILKAPLSTSLRD